MNPAIQNPASARSANRAYSGSETLQAFGRYLCWVIAVLLVNSGCGRSPSGSGFDAKAWSLGLRATTVRGWYIDGYSHEITDDFGETALHPNSEKMVAPDLTTDAQFAEWQSTRFTGVLVSDQPNQYYISGVGHYHCARDSTPEGYCSYPVHLTFRKNQGVEYFELQTQGTVDPLVGPIGRPAKAYEVMIGPPHSSASTLLGSAKISELEFKAADPVTLDGVRHHCFVVSEKALGAYRWERWCVAMDDPNRFFVDIPDGGRHQAIDHVILGTFRIHYSPIVRRGL